MSWIDEVGEAETGSPHIIKDVEDLKISLGLIQYQEVAIDHDEAADTLSEMTKSNSVEPNLYAP